MTITLGIIVLLFGLLAMETTFDLNKCDGEDSQVVTEIVHFVLLASTLGIGSWFTIVAKKQTSDSWTQVRKYTIVIIASIVVSIIIR